MPEHACLQNILGVGQKRQQSRACWEWGGTGSNAEHIGSGVEPAAAQGMLGVGGTGRRVNICGQSMLGASIGIS